jgi:anaerobic ribonucleoside-triphosphate reductase activating protein
VNRHHGTDVRDTLRISRTKDATEVLGPGTRAVIWVMGCELRCRGCIAPETHPHAGSLRETEELGAWSAAVAKDGLTVSGGEPMLQSAAVARLVDIARERRPDLHVMIYTGYRLDWLLRYGSDLQRALLTRVDLLVDGPYVERFHAPVKWRGSRNQRMIDLSGRTPPPT